MENLEAHIFDLVSEAEIVASRDRQDAFADQSSDLRFGIDYDFIIESFYCEYKLDVKELTSIQNQYAATSEPAEKSILEQEFRKLYPECKESNIAKATIPDTILKKAYFQQSPKGRDGLPTVHASLKEHMLSNLRSTRASVKKEMKKAALAHDSVSEQRFNSKQLAIKVVCNSEYGSANNEYFAHYDPDVASCVTRGARRLINFLTTNLECDNLFVDQKFLDEFKSQVENLKSINVLSVEPLKDTSQLLANRRHCIRRLFDDAYNIIQPNIFKIIIKPSIVCYQDTDSNYYKNEYIADYYTKAGKEFVCDPETIDECMHSMLAHNELLGGFIKYSIARRPYELGFEGAFIVCRYLNRKKKYYGIKWGDDAELRLTAKIDNEQAYNPETGFLVDNYMPFWQPKKTVIPQPNGDYIYIDADKLLHQGVNYLDYVRGQDVKCTGVDLARRDQYKFINFFHIVVLQKDLRVMKYNGNGDWTTFSKDEPMKHIIDNVIETFHQIIVQYQSIANLETDQLPIYDFSILDFAKNSAYRYGKQNTVSQIVKRLQKEGKTQYIAGIGERMLFVTILDEETKKNREAGKAKQTNTGERSYVVQEILDQLHEKYPVEQFNQVKSTNLNIANLDYDTYINAKAICLLDIKWYLEYLCKSMALYIVADEYPDEIKRIDDGIISPKDAGALISKLQEKISKVYVEQYFPRDKAYSRVVKQQEKQMKLQVTANRSDLSKRYPTYDFDNLTQRDFNKIIADLEDNKEKYELLLKEHIKVQRSLSTNNFFKHSFKNPRKNELVEKYSDDLDALDKTIADIITRLNNIKACIKGMNTLIEAKRAKYKESSTTSSDEED